MKKEITKANREKLQRIPLVLEGVENNVPLKLKTVFNFKGRKSPLIAQKIIEAITSEEDVIYDPFMGSGAFVISAAKANRKIVATEIDNYTFSAVSTLLFEIDFKKLKMLFERVEKNAKVAVMQLYETSCCGTRNYVEKLFFDPQDSELYSPRPNREFSEGRNIKLISTCPVCGRKDKQFEKIDECKFSAVTDEDVKDFPKNIYIENSRINITKSTGADHYDRIFTKRNQKALLLIQTAISKLEPSIERDVLEHALVSTLSLARISMYGSSTDILYHVVPYGAQEMNVWTLFEHKVQCFISFKEAYSDILCNEQTDSYKIYNESYQDFCSHKALTNAYDLIYTDFPYTDQVPYLERNQLYRIWLETFYDSKRFKLTKEMLEQEIVQSDSPQRPKKKGIEQYYSDIDKMFNTFYRILKDDALVVLTVKLGKSKYFTTLMEIINLARKNGFEYAFRMGIDKNDPTIRKQAAYKNTLSNEMLIVFQKLDSNKRYWYVNNKNYEFETIKLLYNTILKEDISLTDAVNLVKQTLLKKESYIVADDDLRIIQKIITDNFIIDSLTGTVRKDYNKLYLDIEDNTDLFTKFYNYIPVIIGKLLNDNGKFVLDDLYFEIANTLCNGDPKTVNQFLADDGHAADIETLLKNYCETDGRVYTKKNYSEAAKESSTDISMLEGYEFERLIKKLLEAEGYTDVVSTGGSGDLGVDLLAKKLDDKKIKKSYLFQCKRWAANVGSEPMQRLVAEKMRRGADYAICVTTSDFTKDGKLISEEQDIEMWNGETVIQKLNTYFPDEYYNGALDWAYTE